MTKNKITYLLGLLVLVCQQLLWVAPVFAVETTNEPVAFLKFTSDEQQTVSLTTIGQEITVTFTDNSAFSAGALPTENQASYQIDVPEELTYESTSTPVNLAQTATGVTFQFLDQTTNTASFTFRLTSEPEATRKLSAKKVIDGATYQAEDITLEPTMTTESETDETQTTTTDSEATVDTSTTESETEPTTTTEASSEEPEDQATSRSLQPGVVLENDMQVSDDFDDAMTVSEYLVAYQYPHYPKNGVSSAYQSVEVNLADFAESEIALVHNSAELNAAFTNTSIKAISIMKSFAITASLTVNAANRSIVVEGNGMLLDFKRYRYTVNNATRLTIQNLNTYHGDYYGAFRGTGASSLQCFHNVNDFGSQILSSQNMPVIISGDFISRFTVASYVSPIDNQSVTTQYNTQQNFESANIEFYADSNTTLETYSGENIDLTAAGNVIVHKNAKLNLIAGTQSNSRGEGGTGYGISARQASNFVMEANSEVTYTYTDPGNGYRNAYGVVYFRNSGNFSMADGAKMVVKKNNHSGTDGLIHFNAGGTFSLSKSSQIEMNVQGGVGPTAIYLGNSATFLLDDSSKVLLNLDGTGNNAVINGGTSSTFTIDDQSILDIQAKNYQSEIIKLGNGTTSEHTQFKVGENAKVNVSSTGRTNSTNSVVTVGNYADFEVGRLGTFKLSANAARYIFNVGQPSTFKFSDAQLVDFGFTERPADASALINMTSGTFTVDIQRVKAWNRSDSTLDEANPTYDWNPMFGMQIPYTTTTVNNANIVAESTSSTTANSFKTNFNTGPTTGFQRLVYEFIPDVKVSIDNTPVDNPNDANSKTIRGTANPNALIRLTDEVVTGGYSSFPAANNTIPDPVEYADGSVGDNYTVKADANGRFEFVVPTSADTPFVAGNVIMAYAFLSGKSDSATVTVNDTTPPTATPTDQYILVNDALPTSGDFLPDVADSNPGSTVTTEFVDAQETLDTYPSQVGVYPIHLVARDSAGNEAQFTAQLHVLAASQGLDSEAKVSLITEDIKNLSDADFKALLKEKIAASAYRIIDKKYIDLTDKIAYDFSSVEQKTGTYLVTLSVSAEDSGTTGGLQRQVKIFISSVGPTQPVNPDDPGSGEKPSTGTENGGTNASGLLRMDYAPSAVTFGTVPFSFATQKYYAQKATATDGSELAKQWIQISDERPEEYGWTVKVSQSTNFTDARGEELVGATLTIPQGTLRNSEVSDVIDTSQADAPMIARTANLLVGEEVTLFGAKDQGTNSLGKNITTYQWDPTQVTIIVPGGQAKPTNTYSTTVNWSLISQPAQ